MTSRHNLKVGSVSGYCECGSTAISGMGLCRDCFLKANPDLAQHYASNPTKRVVMTSVNTAAKQITTVDPDWLCHMCGIQQPAWAGDCLTCETLPMMGDRD